MMKTFKFCLLAIMMLCGSQAFAQRPISDMTDKELSEYYAQQMKEHNAEIKLVKTRLKGDKGNVEYNNRLLKLQAELKNFKESKKILDKAVKSQAKADKAIAAAEQMEKRAEQAVQAAEKRAEEAKQKAEEAKKKVEEAKQKAEEAKKKAAEDSRKALYIRK